MSELRKLSDHNTSASFAHESEERIAGLLDFYGIEWEYEPTTFVWRGIPKVNRDQHSHQIFFYLNTIST